MSRKESEGEVPSVCSLGPTVSSPLRVLGNVQANIVYTPIRTPTEHCVDAENIIPGWDDVTLFLSSTGYHPKIQLRRFYLMEHCLDAGINILCADSTTLLRLFDGYLDISGMCKHR